MSEEHKQEQAQPSDDTAQPDAGKPQPKVKEVGGPQGPEPTRFGDWEKAGRCSDF